MLNCSCSRLTTIEVHNIIIILYLNAYNQAFSFENTRRAKMARAAIGRRAIGGHARSTLENAYLWSFVKCIILSNNAIGPMSRAEPPGFPILWLRANYSWFSFSLVIFFQNSRFDNIPGNSRREFRERDSREFPNGKTRWPCRRRSLSLHERMPFYLHPAVWLGPSFYSWDR